MCGEHRLSFTNCANCGGSSPHVRGAPRHLPESHDSHGIIPACAGSTRRSIGGAPPGRDHPRMCGEHNAADFEWQVSEGSSPHVRGAPNALHADSQHDGIIPACAGSTRPSASPASWTRDHPRMCGEHSCRCPRRSPCKGSSPHVRGAPCRRSGRLLGPWDHPRMCGEHLSCITWMAATTGSSPHVRGARALPVVVHPPAGIIPACAGSTLKYLAFLGYSSAFSFGSQGSKLFTCVVSYPPNFRAL